MKNVKKQLKFSLLLLILFLSACKHEPSDEKIIFATSAEYPPFEYMIKGELVGFDIELGRLIAKELGKKAKFKDLQFSSILAALQTGMADAAISTITITEARKQVFDFSTPYYVESLAMIYPQQTPLKNKESLAGKKIACQLGTTMEFWLKQHVPGAKIITTDSNPQAVEALKAGHVDGVLIDAVQAVEFVRKNTQLGFSIIAQADLGYGIAFKKGALLKDQVNQALKALEAKGEIEALKKKYLHIKPYDKPELIMKSFIHNAFFISKGIIITLQLLLGSLVIGIGLGLLASIARYKGVGNFIINRLISILRGTPLILQLAFVYFALPGLTGMKLSILGAGILTFGLNSSAYVAEILRSGINSIPKGQFEAAQTLDIPAYYMWKDIILPQVVKNVLPSMISEVITLLKETALIATISGMDIMRSAQTVSAEQATYFSPLCIAGLYYYVLVLLIEYGGRKLEKRVDYVKN